MDRAIFDVLRRIESGARGELQFADTINLFFYEGYSVHVVVHDGIRADLGNPAGFITVNAEIGLRYHKYGSVLFADLEALLEKYRGESGWRARFLIEASGFVHRSTRRLKPKETK